MVTAHKTCSRKVLDYAKLNAVDTMEGEDQLEEGRFLILHYKYLPQMMISQMMISQRLIQDLWWTMIMSV